MLRRLIPLFLLVAPGAPALACDGLEIADPAVHASPLCLPEAPRRVVLLDASVGLGAALDVGLPVVGAPLERMSDERLRDLALERGVESLGFVVEPSLERIVALRPDLIIGYIGSESMAAGVYPMVSRLAPTLLYTAADWEGFHRLAAGLTGQADRIEAELDAYEARLADIRARVPDVTVSVLRITSWDFQVYLDAPETYAPFEVMKRAGIRRGAYETTDDPNLAMKRPDWEELALLDGEILLYIVGGTNDSDTDGRLEEVLANPLWGMLPAVRAGRVHRLDPGVWMEFNGIRSAHRVLDDLERYVIGSP